MSRQRYTVPNVSARVVTGTRISTIEYGAMTSLGHPDERGFITAILPSKTGDMTLRIHKSEIINLW